MTTEPVPLAAAGDRHGAKAATLARLLRAGFPVPDGYVVTAPCPAPGPGRFAVRSSAHGEDGAHASFAGQFRTLLDVPADRLADAIREVISAPTPRAYAARTARTAGPVAAIVQRMVDPEAAGVAFTVDPVTGRDRIVVEAVPGRGDALVDGRVTPHRWTLDGDTLTAPSPAILTAATVRDLARTARRVEALLGHPQDIEWALSAGRLWILQARPVTTTVTAHPTAPPAGQPLLTGTPASPGTATGPARIITGLDDFPRFGAHEILVCHATSPAWTPLLARAAAVVTETGGILAHAAIVAREFGVPAVTGAGAATRLLATGQLVTVDGGTGTVTAAA